MLTRTVTLRAESFTALKIMPTTHAGKDLSGGARLAFERLKLLENSMFYLDMVPGVL